MVARTDKGLIHARCGGSLWTDTPGMVATARQEPRAGGGPRMSRRILGHGSDDPAPRPGLRERVATSWGALTLHHRVAGYVAGVLTHPARAFVVYSGVQRYPHAEGVEAVGLRDLCRDLSAL